ncbi:MAG: hypothetical protein ACI4UE_00505 [Candidatus Scatovivens sp.]
MDKKEFVEKIKTMYRVTATDGQTVRISLFGRPVGVYSTNGQILKVIDFLNLPPQELVREIIAAAA